MTYRDFVALVESRGWTIGQIRCDERPTEELLEAMEQFGLARWERYVLRLEPAEVLP